MPREHWNDVPGDVAGEEAEDLAAGVGEADPDARPEALLDAMGNDINGLAFKISNKQGGIIAGASYAEGTSDGETVDPGELTE